MLWILCCSMMISWSVPPPSLYTPPHVPRLLRLSSSSSRTTSSSHTQGRIRAPECIWANLMPATQYIGHGTARLAVSPMPRDHFVSQRAVANILAQLLLILHHKYKYTDKLKHTLTSVYKYRIPYKAAASPKKVLCYDVLADSCQVHSVFYIFIFVLKGDICAAWKKKILIHLF